MKLYDHGSCSSIQTCQESTDARLEVQGRFRHELVVEQTRLLLKGAKYAVMGNLVVGLLTVIILGTKLPDSTGLWIWFGLLSVVSLLRLIAWLRFRISSPEEQRNSRWLWLPAFYVWANAFLWGISIWLFYPSDYPEYQVMMLLAITGIGGGAMVVLSYHFVVLLVYELLLFGGVVTKLLWLGDGFSLQLMFLVLMYFGFVLRGGYRIGTIVIEGLQLRLAAESNQNALQRARDEAQAASRSKGAFLATMSHEVRAPMNGVLGMMELLLDTPLNERQRQLVNSVRRSSESLLEVINHILDFSKIESGKLELHEESFDLRQLLEDVLEIVSSSCRDKQLQITAKLSDTLPAHVLGDPVRLRQILMNLLGNAVKFTRQGEVSLEAKMVWASDQEIAVRMSVTDTGPGIPVDRQQMIFHPFEQAEGETTTRTFGGTGLGLSIVRELLQLMNSEIELDSESGKGARFSFVLRLRPQQHPRQPSVLTEHAAAVSNGGEQFQGLRVLLAEDNQINREVALAMLANLGIDADVVENGREAVRAVSDNCYHLLLIDCLMPEMNGFRAAETIRRQEQTEQLPRLPIIAITADVTPDVQSRCRATGMDAYLSKPFGMEKLRRKIRQWADPDRCQQLKREMVLNPAVLDELRTYGQARLRRVIGLYLQNAPGQLRATTNMLAAGKLQELASILRSLKSASAVLGAEKFSALCEQMENDARKADISSLKQCLPELEQQFSWVVAALREQ